MKNPFKKASAIATVKEVALGGAGNVAYDYIYSLIAPTAELSDVTKNAIKIGIGVIGGSMVKQSWAKSIFVGAATVGVSNLIAGYMPYGEGETTTTKTAAPAGLPKGMIAGSRLGQRGFRRAAVRGVNATPSALMSK